MHVWLFPARRLAGASKTVAAFFFFWSMNVCESGTKQLAFKRWQRWVWRHNTLSNRNTLQSHRWFKKTAAFPFNGNQVRPGHSWTNRTSTAQAANNHNGGVCARFEMWFLFCTPLLTAKQSPLITDQYCPHVHVVEHYHLHMYHFRVFNLMLRFRFLYFYWRKHLTLVSIYLDWARESLDFCGWEAQPLCASRCFQMLTSNSSSSFRYGSDAFADKCDDKMDAAV